MKFSAASLLFASSIFATTVIPGEGATPNTSEVYIKEITFGGTGCPAGSVAVALSDDLTTFTLMFDKFVASAGPGTTVTESRRNCQVNIDLHYPSGFSYSVATVDFRGYVGIPAGVIATQSANYYFSGSQQQVQATTTFKGPKSEDYLTHNEIEIAKIVWSKCGEVQRGNVNAQVRLEGDLSKPSQITVDSVDGKVKQIYGILWKKC